MLFLYMLFSDVISSVLTLISAWEIRKFSFMRRLSIVQGAIARSIIT